MSEEHSCACGLHGTTHRPHCRYFVCACRVLNAHCRCGRATRAFDVWQRLEDSPEPEEGTVEEADQINPPHYKTATGLFVLGDADNEGFQQYRPAEVADVLEAYGFSEDAHLWNVGKYVLRAGEKVVAVVSALDGETDALFGVGNDVGQGCSDALLARLVRCGELKSAALMGLALERSGIPSAVVDPHEMDLRAEGEALDANLTGLDKARVLARFEKVDVIVAPGFFGEGADGPVTLGRGGTDLTAVEFAHWLGADRVRLIKDVDGVYTDDPAKVANAKRLDQLDYDEAAKVSRGLVQDKAITRAKEQNVVIEVAALGRPYATRIAAVDKRAGDGLEARPLKVAVLGHGAVGAGVCAHLLAHPGRFALNPVLVRDPDQHRTGAPVALEFTADPAEALANDPDIVVETIGGTGLARALSQSVLREGAHLVTANKAVMALDFERLHELAEENGRSLRYSATIGGGVPILELVDLLAANDTLLSVEGVLNGTCNFVLGQLGRGVPLAEAVAEAQRLGFAEADPSADVDGYDAADKLAILVRHAFGVALHPDQISRETVITASAALWIVPSSLGLMFGI
mgnify:CR=1 FL=1